MGILKDDGDFIRENRVETQLIHSLDIVPDFTQRLCAAVFRLVANHIVLYHSVEQIGIVRFRAAAETIQIGVEEQLDLGKVLPVFPPQDDLLILFTG